MKLAAQVKCQTWQYVFLLPFWNIQAFQQTATFTDRCPISPVVLTNVNRRLTVVNSGLVWTRPMTLEYVDQSVFPTLSQCVAVGFPLIAQQKFEILHPGLQN